MLDREQIRRPRVPFAGRLIAGVLVAVATACSLVGSSLDGYNDPAAAGACPGAGLKCAGVCVDPGNTANCGSCGHACAPGEACLAGECKVACPAGQIACGSLCYFGLNDPKHCGDCDTACAPGDVCGDGHCGSSCPPGQTNCGGSCADLQTDSNRCGKCDVVCGPTDECVDSKCIIACKTQLNQPITDPWGTKWDGLERSVSNWGQAKATCEAFRGRLPTTSELDRVSGTRSATVGQATPSYTNPLWSIVPVNATSHVRVRLSDSATGSDADTVTHNYRCVCPPPAPKPYIGGNCNGQPATACFTLIEENRRHNLDAEDRPPVSKGAAIWECAFYHGHLATPLQLAEAIQQGVPARLTDEWLHTGNEANYVEDVLLKWTTGTNFVYQYTAGGPNSMSWSAATDFRPFRCVGENYSPGPSPVTVANEWTSPTNVRKSESADTAQVTYPEALDACWVRGGHLPVATELGELIVQGLPNGSDTMLWTSDEAGYATGSNFLMVIEKWKDTDLSHAYAGGPDFTWDYKRATEKHPYRCIYYPVDTTFAGPPAAACAGGCTTVALPGTSGGKMWIDSFDRVPLTATLAIDACRKVGAHLPSARDMTEAIRGGLPNGQGVAPGWNTVLLTSDVEVGNVGFNLGVVTWTQSQPTFQDEYPPAAVAGAHTWAGGSTWGNSATPTSYRCMWTNELR